MHSVDDIIYQPTTAPVARALISSGAYKVLPAELMDPDNFFTWKSGIRAPVYNDCRVLQACPGEASTVCRSLVASIEANFPDVEVVIGMAESGIYWSAVSASGLTVPHAFVRKQKKEHGVGGMVVPGEELPRQARAVIVDDLMASGGTIESAINQISSECGIQILGVQTIVNWGFKKMRERFSNLSVQVQALTSYPYILTAAAEAGLITPEGAAELNAFYVDPKNHIWDIDALRQNNVSDNVEAC